MTIKEYRKLTGSRIRGYIAMLNTSIKNKGGEDINAGEQVSILGKSARGGYNIRTASGIEIHRVNYAYIDIPGFTNCDQEPLLETEAWVAVDDNKDDISISIWNGDKPYKNVDGRYYGAEGWAIEKFLDALNLKAGDCVKIRIMRYTEDPGNG